VQWWQKKQNPSASISTDRQRARFFFRCGEHSGQVVTCSPWL
jgi:hypothetical protein